jgi:uncharacterized protein (TIGR02466 family)
MGKSHDIVGWQVIKSIFPTLVYLEQLNGQEQSNELHTAVADQLTQLNQPWPEGVKSSFNFSKQHDCFLTNYKLYDFKNIVEQHVKNYVVQMYNTSLFTITMTNSFLNLMQKDGFQFSHNHPFSSISGVYYYQATEADASLTFENPNPVAEFIEPATAVTFAPNTSRLLLFPSWLKHRVNLHKTAADRIAIAFNFSVEPIKE